MTDSKKTWEKVWGGFAHPHPVLNTRDGKAYYDASPGMTLRDWFAGQALVAIFALDSGGGEDAFLALATRYLARQSVAETAYAIADAMIAARRGDQP